MAAACAYVELVYPVGNDRTLTGHDVEDPLDNGPLQGAAHVEDVMGLAGTVGEKDGEAAYRLG